MERRVSAQPLAAAVTIDAVVSECVRQNGGVNDDQRRLRSDRRSEAAFPRPTRPPERPPARSRTSRTVGRPANSFNTISRYSWSDIPCSAALRLRVEWVSSGTSRICTFFMHA